MQTNGLSTLSRDELEAIVLAFQANSKRKLTLKVTKKTGAISVYGFGRFPTTLYKSQWEQLLDMAEEIRTFIKVNDSLLSQGKDDPRFQKEE